MYIRAFAITSNGTYYGNTVTIHTPSPTVPSVNTSPLSNLSENSIQSGGEVLFTGGVSVSDRGVCWSTEPDPSIADNHTSDGGGPGTYSSEVRGLSPNTEYYLRAYATNSAGTAYGEELVFKTFTGTLTDFDGNVYGALEIGSQIWMVPNLRVTRYYDGTRIPHAEENYSWNSLDSDSRAYCWYNNSTDFGLTYGALYNWAAAMNGMGTSELEPSGVQGVCPDGWHLPSSAEWNELVDYLGGWDNAGAKLKESGFYHWSSQNTGATNSSYFTALPGGYRDMNGFFRNLGSSAYFWSTSAIDDDLISYRLYSSNDRISTSRFSYDFDHRYGFSVRCVKDD